MSNESKRNYVLTTVTGMVPYITDYTNDHFKKTRKLFLDDFLQKDSFYDRGLSTDIKKYVGCDEEVIIGFKKTPKVLESKKGNYKLTEDKYKQTVINMNANCYADFSTGKLLYEGEEVYEPVDLDDFNNSTAKLFGTSFINQMVDKGELLYIDGDRLCSKSILDSEDEYHKYIWSLKEIISFTMLAEKNYKVFSEFLNK